MSSSDPPAGHSLNDPGSHGPPPDLDYQVVRRIGQGGYGEVWLVRDRGGEYRACKVVYRESFNHDRPYEREYEGIRKFEPISRSSASQVKILYVGRREAAGYFFYIMELADADGGGTFNPDTYAPRTLRSEMDQRGRLPVVKCVEIGLSLTAALENLHVNGLIHRDIKPANIIFVNGVPKLADIGLVTDADVTVSYVGTSGFIPPEGPRTPQSDIYSLGKTIYEVATGKDRLEYPDLPENFGTLPDHAALLELNAVIGRACESNPEKRYRSAMEMAADLALLKSGRSVRHMRASRHNKLVAVKVFAVAALLALTAMVIQFVPAKKSVPTTNPISPHVQLPLPDPIQVAKSESELRTEFQGVLDRGAGADGQTAAFNLMERAGRMDDPADRLAALRIGAELALKVSDFSLAMEACDRIGINFQTNALLAKASLLAEAGNEKLAPKQSAELARACVKTGFEALGADDYDTGARLAALAQVIAPAANDSRLVQESDFLNLEMAQCRAAFDDVKQFQATLRTNAADRNASAAVGEYRCFVKNDWEAGLPLLAVAPNELLRRAAAAELTPTPKTSESKIDLANLWGISADAAIGREKVYFTQRERFWALQAVAETGEPAKTQLRRRFESCLQIPVVPSEVHIHARVAGMDAVDIYSDEVRWKSGRGASNIRVNEVAFGDFKAGDLRIIKNTGPTFMLPPMANFSSARLVVNHKPKRQGEAKIEARSDHVRVMLGHRRPGYVDLEVTVVFPATP